MAYIFWGPIHEPEWDSETGKVTINAHDPTLRCKHSYARYGDDVVGDTGGPAPDNPIDYRTIRKLIEAASNVLPDQDDYPDLGIKIGANDGPYAGQITGVVDTTIADTEVVGTGTLFLSELVVGQRITVPADGTGETHTIASITDDTHLDTEDDWSTTQGDELAAVPATQKIERGSNIFDEIRRISEARYGPDWEVVPGDSFGLTSAGWPYFGELRTYEHQGSVKNVTLLLAQPNDPDDPNNVRKVNWKPGGTAVRNNLVAVVQGTTETDGLRAIAHDLGSWSAVGIYSGWENPQGSNNGDIVQKGLEDYAHDWVRAYSRPPNFLEVELLTEPRPTDASLFIVEITDLEGTALAELARFSDLETTIPLSDSRTAKVSIPYVDNVATGELAEPACEQLYFDQTVGDDTFRIAALGRMLRIQYVPADAANSPQYLTDFEVGDEVTVVVDKGLFQINVQARITEVRVGQADAAGNGRTTLQLVPKVTAPGNVNVTEDA